MNRDEFIKYLKRGGRSKSAIERILGHMDAFQEYLQVIGDLKTIDQASPDELRSYVEAIESEPSQSAKLHLWALDYCFEFLDRSDMCTLARELRQARIKRRPFQLKDFRGVKAKDIEKLTKIGVLDVKQMLREGKTPEKRQELSQKSGVSVDAITELVKLSDLARIAGLKSIRARLYYDGGIDTVEKLEGYDPQELCQKLIEFVEETGFDGIAPLPKEAANAVEQARKLPKIVQFE